MYLRNSGLLSIVVVVLVCCHCSTAISQGSGGSTPINSITIPGSTGTAIDLPNAEVAAGIPSNCNCGNYSCVDCPEESLGTMVGSGIVSDINTFSLSGGCQTCGGNFGGFSDLLYPPNFHRPSTHPPHPQLARSTFGFSEGSLIMNTTLEFFHWGWDIPRSGPEDVGLVRIHRPVDMAHAGSFGPGVFCNYDLTLTCTVDENGIIQDAELLDPTITLHKYYKLSETYVDKLVPLGAKPLTSEQAASGQSYMYTNYLPSAIDRMKSVQLLDANQDPITHSNPIASYVVFNAYDGSKILFQLFDVGISDSRVGKLKKITTSLGAATTVNFKSWTTQELAVSPTRVYQIDKVTDRYGKDLTFSYSPNQIAGAWVVNQVTAPSGSVVSYTYANNQLSQVNLLSGLSATFSYSTSTTASATKLEINDPAAPFGHQRKTAYLSTLAGQSSAGNWITTPLNAIRLLSNPNDEVTYLSLRNTSSDTMHYEGGGRAKYVGGTGMLGGSYFQGGWYFGGPHTGNQDSSSIVGTLDGGIEYQVYSGGSNGGVATIRHSNGQELQYVNDEASRTIFTLYSDGTFDAYCYDSFSNVTRFRNRLGNVTKKVYDSVGRLIEEHVGLKDNPTTNSSGYNSLTQYNRCATDDVQTSEYAVRKWEYVPAGQSGAGFVQAKIDELNNRTDYLYDGNGRLHEIQEPADTSGGSRASTLIYYNSVGCISSIADPTGSVVNYEYDAALRLTKITYPDGSSEAVEFGTTGNSVGLRVKTIDRGRVVTTYAYDSSGRLASKVEAAAIRDANGQETATPELARTTSYTYVNGSDLVWKTVVDGTVNESQYDHRGRVVKTIANPRNGQTLESTRTYVAGKLFKNTDPYGRSTYYAYDASDQRLVRTIRATVPGWTAPVDNDGLLALTRDTNPNAPFTIQDVVFDAGGNQIESYDGLLTRTHNEFDSRRRTTNTYLAYQTSLESRTQTVYDAAGNVIAVRSPRYFDSGDVEGYQKANETWTYNGRNRPMSHTEGAGSSVSATESFVYDLKGRQATRTDFRGKVWTTIFDPCCEKSIANKNPLGNGSIRNTNSRKQVVHTATVSDVDTHTSDLANPVNAKTLAETTTRYDGLGRVVATTRWLTALAAVDPENPPIAGLGGVSASDGLTTQYLYDNNLSDGIGLDSSAGVTYTKMAASGTSTVKLTNAISKLASAQTSGGAGISFIASAPGRASVVISPTDEVSFTISDASGRTVMSGKLDNYTGTANNLLTWSCTLHDTVTNVSGFGTCLETKSIDALGKATTTLTDGAGRTLHSIDQLSNATVFTYDADSNQLSVRDPNGVGQDVVYDSLGRACLTTDTSGDTTNSTYDKAGNKIAAIDGKSQSTTYTFDARGRQKSQTDRLSGSTSFTYLATGQLASLTDAQSQTTSYTYDDAGGKLTEQYPDHTGGNPGDSTYGIVTFTNDAAGRVSRKQDQKGDTCTFNYDLAGRLTSRDYRALANSPMGTIADSDQFTYDKASRMLTAYSGRYSNTVGCSFDAAGRRLSEFLTIDGQTYTITTEHNSRGEQIKYTYPDGAVVERTYTERGELYQLKHAGTTIDTRGYDSGGRMTSSNYNNGVNETRSYNTDNTLASISFGGSGTAIGNLSYGWDDNKNKISEAVTGTMSNYGFTIPTGGYDSEDRLVSFNRTSGLSQSWSLSAVGDWNSVTTNGTAQTRNHGPTHELLTGGGSNVSTDVKGNITLIPASLRPTASSLTSVWDFDNRLVSATTGSTTVSHQYDALGRCVACTLGSNTTIYVQLGRQTIADYASGAAPSSSTYRYVYASYIDEPVMRWTTSGGTPIYYHRNQQYSVTALTGSTGSVLERYAYTAYGVPTIADASGTVLSSSAQNNRYTYTGREWDNDIQQYDYRERVYDPFLGRFCSRDPIGYFDDASVYQFLSDSPFGYLDPLGLFVVVDSPRTKKKQGWIDWIFNGPWPNEEEEYEWVEAGYQQHHIFPQKVPGIDGLCGHLGFSIHAFTIMVEGGKTTVHSEHWWWHHGCAPGGDYVPAVRDIVASSKDCCDFMKKMIELIEKVHACVAKNYHKKKFVPPIITQKYRDRFGKNNWPGSKELIDLVCKPRPPGCPDPFPILDPVFSSPKKVKPKQPKPLGGPAPFIPGVGPATSVPSLLPALRPLFAF